MEKEWPINKNFIIYNDGRIFNKAKQSFAKTMIRRQRNIFRYSHDKTETKYKVDLEVAKLFVDNPNGYKDVYHIDGDTLNDNSSNLKWVSEELLVVEMSSDNVMCKHWDVDPNYIIYSNGQVYNKKTSRYMLIKPKCMHNMFNYCTNHSSKPYRIDIEVAKLFVHNDNPGEYDHVHHINEDPLDDNYKNLRWTTKQLAIPINDTVNSKVYPENDNYIIYDDGKIYNSSIQKFVTPSQSRSYNTVKFYKNGIPSIEYRVDKIVADLFVINTDPDEYDYLHHINGELRDDDSENLRWTSKKELAIELLESEKKNNSDIDYKFWIEDENYIVVNDGRIYSISYMDFLNPCERAGHYAVSIPNPTNIHIMVAKMFVYPYGNDKNKQNVSHIDTKPFNNNYKNLIWISGEKCTVRKTLTNRAVNQFTMNNEFIRSFESCKLAAEIVGGGSMISGCCRGAYKSVMGRDGVRYKWKYNEPDPEKIPIPENSKKINGFDHYYVTEDGQIYSSRLGNFITPALGNHGYYFVRLYRNNIESSFLVHRLVAEYHIEDKPENFQELYVNHKDGEKTFNHKDNLEYVTSSENAQHSIRVLKNGTKRVKLIDKRTDMVVKIFDSFKDACEEYGCCRHTIQRHCTGKIKCFKTHYKWEYIE